MLWNHFFNPIKNKAKKVDPFYLIAACLLSGVSSFIIYTAVEVRMIGHRLDRERKERESVPLDAHSKNTPTP
ncbi:MAG: hypothetical protein Q8R24_04465 [Legionellaceae bacterium]|nr:hypothetical protein [Legionellaceae bacterium]